MRPLLPLALLALTSCATGSSFDYALPKFTADLHKNNFEYVKFGVVAHVSIPAKLETMIDSMEIGLINDALKQLYAQVPMQGHAIALVNVVVDISKMVVVQPGLFAQNSSSSDDYLVIRADVVRFTAPRVPAAGFYDQSDESVAALASLAAAELNAAATAPR